MAPFHLDPAIRGGGIGPRTALFCFVFFPVEVGGEGPEEGLISPGAFLLPSNSSIGIT